jgi:rod shape-determining protein MreD
MTISPYLGSALVLGLTLLESTFGPNLTLGRVKPDLVLVLVVAWSVLNGFRDGVRLAVVGGLMLDLFSGAPFGVFTFSLIATSALAGLAHGLVMGNPAMLPIVVILPLSIVFDGLSLLVIDLAGRSIDWSLAFRAVLFPAALYNTGVMVLTIPLIYWLYRLQRRNRLEIG